MRRGAIGGTGLYAFFKRDSTKDIIRTHANCRLAKTEYSRICQTADVLGEIEGYAGEWALRPDCVGGDNVPCMRNEDDLCFGGYGAETR
jgi:hypothetical protein